MWGNSGLGIAENTALKRLLLGYDNSTLALYPPERQVDADTEKFLTGLQSRRNAKQLEAIREVFATRKTSRSLATLITGPPGTGKTAVSASIAEWCIKQDLPLLIVAGSNHALDMIGQRIMSTVQEQSLGLSGIYRLETDYLENPEIQTSEAQTSARQSPAHAQFQKIQEVFEEHDLPDVQNFLRASVESVSPPFRDLSLGQFIITRAALAGTRNCPLKDGSAEDQAEYELLSEFICWQHCMRERAMLLVEPVAAITYPGAGPQQQVEDLQKVIGREYQRTWVELQKSYLEKAKVVLCTASTAGRGILRTFKPAYVLVEEASQLSEAECLNGIMAGVPSLQKIVLSGDKQQLPPTVISKNRNECYFWEKESLFERLIRSGHPHVELNVQYRMAPDIAEFVSKQFYNGRLTTDPTSAQSPKIKHWADTMKDLLRCSAGNSFSVSVANTTVLKRLGGSSLVNPEYVSYVGELVQKVLKKGCAENRLMILSYYSEERQVLSELINKKLGHPDIQIKSVDASQGNECSMVIVSTTRPGGNIGLGFVSDLQRMCVALSRAQNCLVVLGHENMGKSQKPGAGKGFQAWDSLIKLHIAKKRLCRVDGRNTLVKQHLNIDIEHPHYESAQF
ncbi:hypothetical protein N7474_003438 [Penicillium riverlandense]|uniref:uncharacterized protein n=1 Tax=Penicillium riverlandense TaxID=1903569 RepID=UPI002548F99E|nr:uncharacterized protein N7474_003438 [Penicillium riverlandense]KAJ5826300.1 hypothetical protein N7474_003438 [Penicillium riverlandense]